MTELEIDFTKAAHIVMIVVRKRMYISITLLGVNNFNYKMVVSFILDPNKFLIFY